MLTNDFIKQYGSAVIAATLGTPLFPSVKMAQLALETGWGKSIKGNNMTGIKADTSWNGKVISFSTREVINGVSQYFTGTNDVYANRAAALKAGANYQTLFRYYETHAESIKDHSRFLLTKSRYAPVLAAKTPEAQAQQLEACGYATDPQYAETLISLINKYNLKSLDEKKK